MMHGKNLTTEADIDAALERSKEFDRMPRALTAQYNAGADAIVVGLTNGRRLIVPREELEGLEDATESQLSEIEIYSGLSLAWPKLDVDHYLPYLLVGSSSPDKLIEYLRQNDVRAA